MKKNGAKTPLKNICVTFASSVSGYKTDALINRLLSNTKKSFAKDMR